MANSEKKYGLKAVYLKGSIGADSSRRAAASKHSAASRADALASAL